MWFGLPEEQAYNKSGSYVEVLAVSNTYKDNRMLKLFNFVR